MGLSFAILLHLILYGLLAAILTLAARLVRRKLKPCSPALLRALRIAPFLIAALPLSAFVVSIIWANVAPPSYLYRSVFNQPPGPTVERLVGRSVNSNDAQEVFLSFAGSDTALRQVLSGVPFQSMGAAKGEDLVPMPSSDAPPTWWTAAGCPTRAVYLARSVRHWDAIVVTNCRSDAAIYVQARWVD